MTYYALIQNDKINGTGQCKCLNDDILNVEITEEQFNNIEKYIWNGAEVVLNPDYDSEQLAKAKDFKYQEANTKANQYLQSGNALYEFEENKHIEATDGNIAKMTAYALAYVTGQLQPTDTVVWNTKEDETVELNQQQIVSILNGLGVVQATVWSVQYPSYLQQINDASTIDEVNAIVINYETVGE